MSVDGRPPGGGRGPGCAERQAGDRNRGRRREPPPRLATTGPIIDNVGCTANSLARNDDGSSGRVTLPFVVRLYNRAYTGLYVNNNGNVTFRTPLSAYTPGSINVADRPIIAPFWADVDTRPASSSVVQYGTTTFGGRQAFCVNWNGVG